MVEGANVAPLRHPHPRTHAPADRIQRRVLDDFGFDGNDEAALHEYRCTHGLYVDDPEVRECAIYMKYDVSRRGDLRVGMQAVDVELMTRDGERFMMLDKLSPDRPLVIAAGYVPYSRPVGWVSVS